LTYTDADATVTQVRINGIKNQSGMTILAIEALI
jgi:hypothetical protein